MNIMSQLKALGACLLQRVSASLGLTLKRGLVAMLVGVSLWSISAPAQAADANDYYENERGAVQSTERYDTIQPKTGEFNNFEDTDPRRNTQSTEAKARALQDTAERQRAMDAEPLGSAGDAFNKIKSKLGETADDLTNRASDAADEVTDYTRRK